MGVGVLALGAVESQQQHIRVQPSTPAAGSLSCTQDPPLTPSLKRGSTLPAEQPDNPAGRPPCWSRSRASTHFSGTRIKQPRRHAPDPGTRAGGGTRTCHPGTPEADRQPSSQARPPAVGGGGERGGSSRAQAHRVASGWRVWRKCSCARAGSWDCFR